jgi:hypothetical protein
MPDSKFKIGWSIVVILLLLYTATFVPYRVAFIDSDAGWITTLDDVTDILFGIDIIINFLSSYEKPDLTLETDIKQIAKNYVSFWFPMDFLAIIPF